MSEHFSQWAVLEIMGRRRIVGLVSEVTIAGQGMLRIDVPDGDPPTQFYGASSVFCITPVTEESARMLAAELPQVKPIDAWEIDKAVRPQIVGDIDDGPDVDPWPKDDDEKINYPF